MIKRFAIIACVGSLLAGLLLGSCSSDLKTSSLVINQIIDPNTSGATLNIALSRTPDFVGGFKTEAAIYTLGSAAYPAVSLDAIAWQGNDDQDADAFWLLIAWDFNGSSTINDGDNILPAMRVFLEDGKTTTIDTIVFDMTPGPPDRVFNVTFTDTQRTFNIFVENRNLVSPAAPMYLRLGGNVDLSTAAAATYDIPITDGNLVSGLYARTLATNGFAWIDLDGNGDLSSGDWMSTVDPSVPANTDISAAFNSVLWSGQTF
ncbi:MAG: hypothetical protein E4H20_06260 [Spirochaetales bacterium]|nr:MAG: hypothetical protein E4H20_06260 [Spirochaetales bacterium]